MRCWPVVVVMLSFFIGSLRSSGVEPSTTFEFLRADGDKLFDGDQEFRFVSFNIPNLHLVEDNYLFDQTNPWRWPDEFEIADALGSIEQLGGRVVRSYVISVRREDSGMGDICHVFAPGEFNEEGFLALDRVLAHAKEKRIRVILPLVDNWHWWGGAAQYAGFRGKSVEAFWTDGEIRNDFKLTIQHVINRKNTVTGVRYKDDPTIFGWETGNEIDSPPEWTRDIASYIKSLDMNHLVIDGNSLRGVQQSSIDDPNIDVLTSHHYPNAKSTMLAAVQTACRATKGRKPFFVGEFGFIETEEIDKILKTVIDEGLSGALLWSLRPHRREGGFYWHSEGDSLYKAYHWPGFASGDAYDERSLLRLVRTRAFQIRGLTPPDVAAPHSPRLLPISDASHITWQGATGASAYDVQRSTATNGGWITIARDVSDAEKQYRSAFSDTTFGADALADFAGGAYYRVVAKNEAGESAPSNVVGPVKLESVHFVDEFSQPVPDAKVLISRSVAGSVRWLTKDARRVQEDIHRLTGISGDSITYELNSPLKAVSLFVFVSDQADDDPSLSTSADGVRYTTMECSRVASDIENSDYGYLTPVLFESQALLPNQRFLRISFSSTASVKPYDEAVQLSRLEVECASP